MVELYNAAFLEDFIRYGECPAYGRSVEEMERSIKNYPKDIILYESDLFKRQAVGVISSEIRGEGVYYIGCLCVIPEFQNMGIGTAAFADFKLRHSDWKEIYLITPADKERNIYFYTVKCGMKIEGREMDGKVEVVRLVLRREEKI